MRIPDEERALAEAARAGDQTAFAGLVRLHQRRAYLVARAIVTVHDDAEDAVQDGFVRAWQAIERFDPSQGFSAWLNRIVANAALDITRRRKVRSTEELTDALRAPFRDPAQDAELKSRLAKSGSLTLVVGPRGAGDTYYGRVPQCEFWQRPVFSYVNTSDGRCDVGFVCAAKISGN